MPHVVRDYVVQIRINQLTQLGFWVGLQDSGVQNMLQNKPPSISNTTLFRYPEGSEDFYPNFDKIKY